MIPSDFPQADRIINKPFADALDQVYDVPAFFGADADRYKQICFIHVKPTKEDIENMIAGSGIYIKIFHPAIPAMHLQTENPFAPNKDLYVWMVSSEPVGDYPTRKVVAVYTKALQNHFVSDDYFTIEQINQLNFLFNNSQHPDISVDEPWEDRMLRLQEYRRLLIEKLRDIEKEANSKDDATNQ
jgi:hypothetical protein